MNAIILAAGYGTRMRPLTYQKPKCLLEICGKPLLYWQLELFRLHDIKSVYIVVHYLADQIVDYVKEYVHSSPDMAIECAYESELLGSGGSVARLACRLEEGSDFIVINGDNLTNVDFTRMISFHQKSNAAITCGLFETSNPTACGIVSITDGRIISFEEKPVHPKSNLANSGIYIMNKKLLVYFPRKEKFSLERDLFPNIAEKMNVYNINCYLRDIGNINDYHQAQIEWKQGDLSE